MHLNKLRTFGVALLLFIFSAVSSAQTSVTAIALFKDRAMLSVNGQKAKIIRAGSTLSGVKLISATTDGAVIEIDGKRETLQLNSTTVISDELGAFDRRGDAVVEIPLDEFGFFQSLGTINGRSIKFLVDTGASLVVLSSQQADSLGLRYRDGRRGIASTASGTAPMYNINLDRISVGGIMLNNVEAGVIEGGFPEKPLLGMTFLNQVDMTRSGNLMTLKER